MGTEIKKEKLVSVVMSTYNRATTYLPGAIQSVIDQSYQNWELFVVDDCSPDETESVVKDFIKKDSRIKYIRLRSNFGKDTRPKNEGILQSKGEYITYLDDDCTFYKHHIERLVDEIEASHVDVVYCEMVIKDITKPDDVGQKGIAMDFDAQYLLKRNFIDTSMMLHKREAIYAIGGWDETLPRFVDWNVCVRMMKAGMKFHWVPEVLTTYYVHPNNSATAHPVPMRRDPVYGVLFEPTFDPAGCYIYLDYLLNDKPEEKKPRVAVFTLSYDRKEYTEHFWLSINDTAEYPFDWFVIDQGSKDGSPELLQSLVDSDYGVVKKIIYSPDNKGITGGSNILIDEIKKGAYDIIIKADNDCQFMTKGWLSSIVDLWRRNHKLYMSPYIEGLVDNPGGAHRVGYAFIGPYFIEVTKHIGGILAAVDASAYDSFRWTDQFLHGYQDTEASHDFMKQGFMPMYLPLHRITHMDGTEGQKKKFPEYFERRKKEKTQVYKS